jgi:hypothetical protein
MTRTEAPRSDVTGAVVAAADPQPVAATPQASVVRSVLLMAG